MASRTSLHHPVILNLTVCLVLLMGSAVPAWSALIEFRCTDCVQNGTVNDLMGGDYSGENIVLNEVEISGAPLNNGIYVLEDGILNFNTSFGTNFLTVGGVIKDIGAGDIVSATLVSGSFSDFGFFGLGSNFVFSGIGPDDKDPRLLAMVGLTGSEWTFASTAIGGDWYGTSGTPTTVAGVTNTTVPIPPSLLLFGTGLIGLVGISRRQGFATFFKGEKS